MRGGIACFGRTLRLSHSRNRFFNGKKVQIMSAIVPLRNSFLHYMHIPLMEKKKCNGLGNKNV